MDSLRNLSTLLISGTINLTQDPKLSRAFKKRI